LLIASGTPAPSHDVRSELSIANANSPNASAVVIENSALPIAIGRTVVATVRFLAPKSMKVDTFRDAESGYAWPISGATTDKSEVPPWGEVSSLVDRVRALRPR